MINVPLQSLPDALTDPFALGVLTVVIVVLVEWQKGLGWYEYRAIHRFKVAVLPLLDKHTGLFVVSDKGGHDDREFMGRVGSTSRDVFTDLVTREGFSPHVICSIKRRTEPVVGGPQHSVAHVVKSHEDGMQTEVYLFDMGNMGTDIYAHVETGVSDPEGHLGDGQQDGDPRGVLPKWVTEGTA